MMERPLKTQDVLETPPQNLELEQALEECGLAKYIEKLTNVDGDVGLETMQDLQGLSDQDLEGIADSCGMNLVQKKRLIKLAQGLRQGQSEKPNKDQAEAAQDLDFSAIMGGEAEEVEEFMVMVENVYIRRAPRVDGPVVGITKKGRILLARRERVLGNDGRPWVEVTASELQRSLEPGAQASRGFVLMDGEKPGDSTQLRAKKRTQDLDGDDMTYKATSDVSIFKSTDERAMSLGCLKKGTIIRAKRELENPRTGVHWVELSDVDLWRWCQPDDLDDRGFVRLSQLQHEGASSHEPVAFPGITDYGSLYRVGAKMVYVKASADKNSKTVGCLKPDQCIQCFRKPVQDISGHDWVELTNYELWHSCRPDNSTDLGFALINGTHLGLGVLLEGPLSTLEMELWQQEQLEEYQASMQQRLAEEAAREADARDVEERMKHPEWKADVYRYRALRDKVFMKWSEDPRHEWIAHSACKPGTSFYSSGMEWRGPNGERWVDGVAVDGKPRWVLTEDLLAQGPPYLIQEEYAEEHTHVKVNYMTALGPKVFQCFTDGNASAGTIKERFSRGLNIRPDIFSIMVKPPGKDTAEPYELSAKSTLASQGITSNTRLFAQFEKAFFEGIMSGRTCGWL